MTAAVTLATDEVRLVVLPDVGAKIASLEHRPSGREWLLAPPEHWPARPAYGSSFTAAPLWGWDEMVPTIDACGDLPDHGEAWALPWRAERLGEARLRCSVEGRALPYRLARTVELRGAVATLDYELSATAPIDVLWAAHPQLVLDPDGTRVVLPASVEWVDDVTSGERRRLDAGALAEPLRGLPRGAGRKLYVDPGTAIDRIDVVDRRGPWLAMRWDAAALPYFGAWVDHGSLAPRPVIVPEPTNGYYDSLERAVRAGRAAAVAPGRPLRWRLEIELGDGARLPA